MAVARQATSPAFCNIKLHHATLHSLSPGINKHYTALPSRLPLQATMKREKVSASCALLLSHKDAIVAIIAASSLQPKKGKTRRLRG